jgi:CubicO group peptidase (beta-lactamase class C family)
MPIEAFIQERIIEPLNLKNTYVQFAPDSTWAKLVPTRYQWNESLNIYEKTWGNDQPQSWKFFTGSLGLWMSAEDYSTFMRMWINDGKYNGTQILRESTVKEALKIQVNTFGEIIFGHGYGWFIDDQPKIFRYGGSAGGVGIGYPDKNTIVIYLTHCAGGNHEE